MGTLPQQGGKLCTQSTHDNHDFQRLYPKTCPGAVVAAAEGRNVVAAS